MYQTERTKFYVEHVPDIGSFMLMDDADKVMWMMSEKKIKQTSDFIQLLYDKRRSILYNLIS